MLALRIYALYSCANYIFILKTAQNSLFSVIIQPLKNRTYVHFIKRHITFNMNPDYCVTQPQ